MVINAMVGDRRAKYSPGRKEKFRREWTLALGDFINTKSNIILLQHCKIFISCIKKRSLICIGLY
jgi:hypothetical protein